MTDAAVRLQRAIAMKSTHPLGVEKLEPNLWLVLSESGRGSYRVHYDPSQDDWSCTCQDFKDWRDPCKHIFRVYLEWFPETKKLQAEGQPAEKKVYRQDTASYDAAQEEELRLLDVLLRALVDTIAVPGVRGRQLGRPRIPQSDQFFCGIRKVYIGKALRRARSHLEYAVDKGHLPKRYGFTVPSRLFNAPETNEILQELVTRSAMPIAALEEGFAPDSTGLQSTLFGAWREDKHGDKRQRLWLKAHALVGVKTQAIVAAVVTDKDGSDYSQFEHLIRVAKKSGFNLKTVYADGAYTGRLNYAIAEELGIELLSPFRPQDTSKPTGKARGRHGLRPSSRLWQKTCLFFQLNREEFEAKYHKRSVVEAVFSSLKRKVGETVRSRTRMAQENEILAKIICHNLMVLIHEFYEHGVIPDFLIDPSVLEMSK
jgi:transposase